MKNVQNFVLENLPDNEIIARVLQGQKELYAVIVRRYNQRLYKVGMAILNNDTEVEDVMQVTYINAYENVSKFAFRSTFATWITRILINECLSRLKKGGKSIALNVPVIENEVYYQTMKETLTPAAELVNSELKMILTEAIRQLPEIYRVVFIMREIENMNVAETKQCLDISEANVKVRLNRAKAILKNALSAFYKKEDILHFHLSRCDRMAETVMMHVNQLSQHIEHKQA